MIAEEWWKKIECHIERCEETRFHTLLVQWACFKGTVSQTAHVQVINQKWSDVFKFAICETKWRQQFRQQQEKGTGEVEKKNSARNKYLQVMVTGQT